MGTKATGVFWDLVDLPIPPSVNPYRVHENVRTALAEKGFPVDWASFCLYVDDEHQFSDDMVNCFQDAGMTFQPGTPACRKDRATALMRDVNLWAIDNPLSDSSSSCTLMLVSSSFTTPFWLEHLETLQSDGYKVLLVQADNLVAPDKEVSSQPLENVSFESLEWLWKTMFRVPTSMEYMCTCLEFHKLQRTCVLWDLEDYPIPYDVDFVTTTENIQASLEAMNYLGQCTFHLYFENQPLTDAEMKSYNDAEKMCFYIEADKLKRVNKMFLHAIMWSIDYSIKSYRLPLNLVLVSKCIPDGPEFLHVLNKLNNRCTKVFLIHPDEAPSSPLISTLQPEWLYQSALGETPIISPCDSCAHCTSRMESIKRDAKRI
ncbi:hypothetical protein AALP_AA1G063400 [Arabis alpina]|uniref:NYN domain-containing protein n=1 Tax=Arabis alpina TaxID=50452 RepID=A0A087HLH2_ARAAL|nr:hypothetical protein AALP_AA1G063400 [Arabis alpina]